MGFSSSVGYILRIVSSNLLSFFCWDHNAALDTVDEYEYWIFSGIDGNLFASTLILSRAVPDWSGKESGQWN